MKHKSVKHELHEKLPNMFALVNQEIATRLILDLETEIYFVVDDPLNNAILDGIYKRWDIEQ